MRQSVRSVAAVIAAFALFGAAAARAADDDDRSRLEQVVGEVVRPLMAENGVPGMAVALVVQGRRHVFSYGLASKAHGRKVDERTIFEVGSLSKTFTATLGAYAQATGVLSLSDEASKHLSALAGTSFDRISLLDLATYAAGGLPLQFPDEVTDQERMIAYYRAWRPTCATGSCRVYSNPSIGLFGFLAARSMGQPFEALMEKRLFPLLGLTDTFLNVPGDRMQDYAYGYSRDDQPMRVAPGVLHAEAYGVKATAGDMIRFVEANMTYAGLDERLRSAIEITHTGYFQAGGMTQGLGWEIYPYPTDLERLLAGNSSDVSMKPNGTTRLDPPRSLEADVLLNKTGSTNGFGAYAAFIPAKRVGVVMLANKNYPVAARVRAAFRILSALADAS